MRPLRDRRVGDAARVAWLLVGAVAAFLLIACVNVTNLMLARVGERRREFAVRAAIGAGRMRLARLALAESLLLSLAAGGVGLLVAFALLETFVAMAPPGIPGIAEASIDLRVFVVAALLVVVTGTAIGLWPAISVFRAGGPARAALDGHVIAGRAAARPVCAGHHADRADAGAARRLRAAAAEPVERGQRAARLRRRARRHADRGAQPRPVSDGRAWGRVLRRAARTRAGHAGCGVSRVERCAAATRASGATRWRDARSKAGRSIPTRLMPTIRIRSVTPHYFETFRIPVIDAAGRSRRPIGPASRPSRSTSPPNECCLPESARSDAAFGSPRFQAIGGQPAPARRGTRWSA